MRLKFIKMIEKYKLIPKKLEMAKSEIQEYCLDENPKANFAEYRKKEKKICVNSKFEKLSKQERIAILYHERGHSNFYLWGLFKEIGQFFYLLSLIFIVFSIILFLTNQLTNNLIFNIPNLIWSIFFLTGIFLFVGFVSINYLLKIIADIYSVAKTNNLKLAKCIKNLYNAKEDKKGLWAKYILHPSPSIREKIMKTILKW